MGKILASALLAAFVCASGAAYAQQDQGFGAQAGWFGFAGFGPQSGLWAAGDAILVPGQACPYGQPLDGSGVGPGDGTQPQPRDGTGFGSPWNR